MRFSGLDANPSITNLLRIIMFKILFRLGVIGTIALAATSGTGAFFSDTESSTGNTFSAGAIDLKIDNESYYNGAFNPGTSWELKDLGEGDWFFNFLDLKPDDEGEDTISVHVFDNDAWACMNIEITENSDNGCTEPESEDGDTSCGDPGVGEGELQDEINFIWWADDGDNVLEDNEMQGVFVESSLGDIANTSVILADSSGQGILNAGPLVGAQTYYIGKAWCFGTLTPTPIAQDEIGKTEGSVNGPLVRGTGISCDGTLLNNKTQTDSVKGNISFTAVQSRSNPGFLCDEEDCQFDDTFNLVTNGGFETPLVNTQEQWNIFDSVAGGWTVEWRDAGTNVFGNQNRPDSAHLELHRGVLGAADEGEQYAELDSDWGGPSDNGTGEPASIKIYQDIVTVPGASYKIRFAWAPRPNTVAGENNLEVKWGGAVVDTLGPTADPNAGIEWTDVEIDVVATDALTRLEFTDLGTSNSLGTFLDDVEVTQQSCPNIDR